MELIHWLDTVILKHFGQDRDLLAEEDFFQSQLFKSLPSSK